LFNLPGCLKTPKADLLSGFLLNNLPDLPIAPPDGGFFLEKL
jgi:hypothetical protein